MHLVVWTGLSVGKAAEQRLQQQSPDPLPGYAAVRGAGRTGPGRREDHPTTSIRSRRPALLPKNSFSGTVAVVTGGSSGIGEGIAVKLGGLGATVAVYGRRTEPLQRVEEQIRAAGGSATSLTGDVRDRQRVEEVLDELTGEHGAVTHLVNNAAGNFRVQPEELKANDWDAVVDIVLNGTWNFTQAVAQRNLRAGLPLSVVCIGTVGALNGGPTTAHSATAKAGVLAMVKSLAGAWGPAGIRLNMVTPGPISNTGGARALIGSGRTSSARHSWASCRCAVSAPSTRWPTPSHTC